MSRPFTYALTSSCVMRPLTPVPVTLPKSAPSSRANLRTDGLAWAREKAFSSIVTGELARDAGAAGAAAVGAAVALGAALCAGALSAGAAAAAVLLGADAGAGAAA